MRAARFRSLPERFAGDSFRNVTLLSLAAARARTYLAYAADVGGRRTSSSPVRRRRALEQPVTIGRRGGATSSSRASPPPAGHVHVSFLDRRLAATFVDEWLASSDDRGRTGRRAAALARLVGPGDRRAALAHRRPAGRSPGAGRRPLHAVALAADPHLANARRRDRDFDRGRRANRPRRSSSPGRCATGGAD